MPFTLQILTDHQENAEFALAMCQSEPFVLSGGDVFKNHAINYSV